MSHTEDDFEETSGVGTPEHVSKFEKIDQKLNDIIARLPEPEERSGVVHKIAGYIEQFSGTRLLAALGIWLFVATVAGIYFEYTIRAEERAARHEEADFRKTSQLSLAWDSLLQRLPGNSGKGTSINLIASELGPSALSGLDLSCQQIGLFQADVSLENSGECIRRSTITGVNLPFPDCGSWGCDYHAGRVIDSLNLAGTELQGQINFVVLRDISLSNSFWTNVILRSTRITGYDSTPDGFACRGCKFVNLIANAAILENLADTFILGGAFWVDDSSQAQSAISPSLASTLAEPWEGSGPNAPQIFAHLPPIFWLAGEAHESGLPQNFSQAGAVAYEYYERFEYCVPELVGWEQPNLIDDWIGSEARQNSETIEFRNRSLGSPTDVSLLSSLSLSDALLDSLVSVRENFEFLTGDDYALFRENSFMCGLPYSAVSDLVEATVRRQMSDNYWR